MTTPAITRRALLTTAAGLTLAACSNAPATPKLSASPTGTVRQQLQVLMTTLGQGTDKLGMALVDLRSGAAFDFNGDYASQLASAAKPFIVSMAMRHNGGATLAEPQATQAAKAIEHSDNDSADALFEWAGRRPAFDLFAQDAGLGATHSDPSRDAWSWCWTTPKDLVAFVRLLLDGGKALDAAERAALLDLMGKVEDAQAWGVGAPRSAEVAVALKNGWVQFQSTDKLWAVNSLGHVKGAGRDYVLAVMTRMPTFEAGRDLVTEVGRWTFDVLGSGTLT